MKSMRIALVVLSVAFAVTGCAQMEQAQFDLHQEQYRNIELFGTVANTYATAADQMADKKHDLQETLIERTSDSWIKDHTDDSGNLTATPDDLRVMLSQRDGAIRQLVESQKVWTGVSSQFRTAIQDFLILNKTIAAKDMDVQDAKDKMRKAGESVLGVITTIGGGLAIGAAAL